MKSKVKWFNEQKGFGFIVGEGDGPNQDIFFHHTNCDGSYQDIREDDRVEFDLCSGNKGLHATNVKLLPD